MAEFQRKVLETTQVQRRTGEVVDGMHRIIRAWLEGRTAIEAVRLERMPTPDRAPAPDIAVASP